MNADTTPAPGAPAGDEGVDPPYLYPDYVSTRLRAPLQPLLALPRTVTETSGPVFGARDLGPLDDDLTRQHRDEPLGERIIVAGLLTDTQGRPLRGQLIEIWQANAAGRYLHGSDEHSAPLDPNFSGAGRCVTDDAGRYRFVTIKPGAYPWRNHANAWRPAHIHLSLFGQAHTSRLVTQMYFPGDPLLELDPVYSSITDPRAAERLVCVFDLELTRPEWALGYRFDITLRAAAATPMEVR